MAWFKKGSGTFVRSTLRAVPAKVPDPFLNHAQSIVTRLLTGSTNVYDVYLPAKSASEDA